MLFRLGNLVTTIISAYLPTMTYPDEEKERFYENLKTIIRKTAHHDKLILLGGFNARVGSDLTTWERVIGHHVVGSENSNGSLLTMCAEFQLVITNTLFQQAEKIQNIQNIMDAPTLKTLASDRLHYNQTTRHP